MIKLVNNNTLESYSYLLTFAVFKYLVFNFY